MSDVRFMPRARGGMRASSRGARPRVRRLGERAVMGCSPCSGARVTVSRARVSRAIAASVAAVIILIVSGRADLYLYAQGVPAATDPALFRIFLKDGTALASYGEFARVGDRVVFTLPLGEDRQQLATVGAGEVDWTRTDAYAYAVRAGHYAATQGESDYATMSTRIARSLTEIAQGTNPNDQLRQAQDARRELAEWPARHFGYKADEIRETLGVLDEVIAGLRAKGTGTRFDISLVAGSVPPPPVPLLAKPSLQDSIAQVLRLATMADSPAERVELLRSADAAIDGVVGTASAAPGTAKAGTAKAGGANASAAGTSGEAGGAEWAIAARASIRRSIEAEAAIDRDYAALASRVLARADRRMRRADVRGLTRLRDDVLKRDARLGGKRPQQLDALLETLNQRLDAAQRLRLARDRWALQAETFRLYRRAIGAWVDVLRRAEKPLNDIRALAGPPAATLADLERRFRGLDPAMRMVLVPVDLRGTHASLVSAWQLADTAINQRQRAIARNDIDLARNASAAAAGSLMLFERVQMEIARSLEAPKAP
jgi:hypothetical protein